MKRLQRLLLFVMFGLVVFLTGQPTATLAQESPEQDEMERPFTIIVYVARPWFYEEPEGNYTGFIAELWEAIAEETGLEYEIILENTIPDILKALEDGRADAIIAPVTMTADREETMDFTYPIVETSGQIAVSADTTTRINYLKLITTSGVLRTIGIAFIVLFVMANLLWLAEYRHEDTDFSHKYIHGIWEALWWAVVTATTVGYGDITPKRTVGRLLALFWILGSLFFVSVFAAQIVASLTAQQIAASSIAGPDDLYGMTVGSIGGATATYLDEKGIDNIVYAYDVLMFSALENGRIDAIVGEQATLAHYAATTGRGKIKLVGSPFNQSYAGFALSEDSPYLEPINQAILTLRNNGIYNQIHEQYFEQMN